MSIVGSGGGGGGGGEGGGGVGGGGGWTTMPEELTLSVDCSRPITDMLPTSASDTASKMAIEVVRDFICVPSLGSCFLCLGYYNPL